MSIHVARMVLEIVAFIPWVLSNSDDEPTVRLLLNLTAVRGNWGGGGLQQIGPDQKRYYLFQPA